MRLQGQIGSWRVNLEVEWSAEELAVLGRQWQEEPVAEVETAAVSHPAADTQQEQRWAAVLCLLKQAKSLSGPQLLEELTSLCGGNTRQAKQLMVRLRHSPEVRMEHSGEVPCYHWVGD